MTNPRRLTEHEALAATREEPRPSPLDAANERYEAALTRRRTNHADWWEALPTEADGWHVIRFEWTTYEPDCNYWNWAARECEPCSSQYSALILATGLNCDERFQPAD